MKTVIVFDLDSHRFRIPKSQESEFERLNNLTQESKWGSDEFYNACEELDDKFGEYRVDGC